MNFEEAWKISQNIPGWLRIGEARVLYEEAKACSEQEEIVEIGSFCGKSTSILSNANKSGIVIAIDPLIPDVYPGQNMAITHKHPEQFLELCTNQKNIRWLRMTSQEVFCDIRPNIKIGCLFIDGNHSYPSPKQDFILASNLLSEGASVLFHDYGTYEGVNESVNELHNRGLIKMIKKVDSLAICKAN